MSDNQCCSRCGYLSVRDAETFELVEVPPEYRETGVLPMQLARRAPDRPYCFVQAHDLGAEYDSRKGGSTENHAQANVKKELFHAPRECAAAGKFVNWSLGFTPKEHLQIRVLEDHRIAEQQRAEQSHAWNQERDKVDREFRESQAAQAREWRREDEIQDRSHRNEDIALTRWTVWTTVWVSIVSSIIGGIVGALATALLGQGH